MQNTLNFFSLIFWICLLLILFESYNFLKILLVTEIAWVLLYSSAIYIAALIDSSEMLTFSLLLLGIAGLEFSIALIVVLVYKNIYNSIMFDAINLKK